MMSDGEQSKRGEQTLRGDIGVALRCYSKDSRRNDGMVFSWPLLDAKVTAAPITLENMLLTVCIYCSCKYICQVRFCIDFTANSPYVGKKENVATPRKALDNLRLC